MMRHPRVWMGPLLGLAFSSAQAEWAVNMLPGATEVSRSVFDLHMIIFWICVVIGVVVFGVMFWSMLMHRRSTGQKPAHFHESTTVEILWTVVPFVILVVMAVPATQTLIEIYDTSESDAGHPDHRLPVEVALQVPGPGRRVLQQPGHPGARRSTTRPPRARTTCWRWTSRWWCRWAPRCAS